MRHLLIAIFLLFLVPTPSPAGDFFKENAKNMCGNILETIESKIQTDTEIKANDVENLFELPSLDLGTTCVSGLNLGGGFSLGVPSLESLINAVCKLGETITKKQIDSIQAKLSYEKIPGVDVGGNLKFQGGGKPGQLSLSKDVDINTNSQAKANEVVNMASEGIADGLLDRPKNNYNFFENFSD